MHTTNIIWILVNKYIHCYTSIDMQGQFLIVHWGNKLQKPLSEVVSSLCTNSTIVTVFFLPLKINNKFSLIYYPKSAFNNSISDWKKKAFTECLTLKRMRYTKVKLLIFASYLLVTWGKVKKNLQGKGLAWYSQILIIFIYVVEFKLLNLRFKLFYTARLSSWEKGNLIF